ncbi:putative leucine-rich repeat receptor-like protein kinase IMK3 [Dendrobium catenatum]|uniref:Putative leucine-rich repeat receptor-like protein kinase IMK3 n=1 Tax=Dendrobium catenatum TaxID=906689 RepID=A0A2I0VEZ4_9ASPA|nr:putative leucine-rich repeat receptor-like protein kinase IMK3 [Dendrobium catenatum]
MMGKSTVTMYKETSKDGNLVAVKRLSTYTYYLGSKGEKLLFFDFMTNGSLAAFLLSRGSDTPIDLPTRMSIAMGTVRGLSHLHNNVNINHGNLTGSNSLLDDNYKTKIADYDVSRLMTAATNSNVIATAGALGFRALELSKLKKASTNTNVYSLGVIMLELITRKWSEDTVNGADLPQWLASIVNDAARNAGDELLNTLKAGVALCGSLTSDEARGP